ncbi:MAG: GntR family transcriptional regulator [Candidatus Polarisedimenticolia bacterium]
MDFDLDPGSPVPIYQQLVLGLRRQIAIGALRPGDRLPTVRELAVRHRVNRNTAARAVQELEARGVVRTRVGQGTFVADDAEGNGAERDTLFDEALDRLVADGDALGVPRREMADRLAARLRRLARAAKEGR